jgi:hypothetical protein
VDDVVALALTDAVVSPIERVLPAPHEWTNLELNQTELLEEFALQTTLDGLTTLESTSRCDPEWFDVRERDAKKECLILGSQEDRADGLAIDE